MPQRPLIFCACLLALGCTLRPDTALAGTCTSRSVCSEALRNIAPLTKAVGANTFAHRGYLTPAELRAMDTRDLAETLVARLQRECEDTRPPEGPGEPMSGDIMMVVPSAALPSIARHGFVNQHVTNSSGGLTQTNARLRKEELLIGMQMPYSSKTRELLPKYGLFNIHRDDVGKVGIPDYYGDVTVVFKKQVARRTTWTRTDSLVTDFDSSPEEFPPRTTSSRYDPSRPWTCRGYCEAQVWGPLGNDDVDHVMIKKGSPLTSDLKALGVPVYEFEGVSTRDATLEDQAKFADSHQAAMLTRGAKIYDGGPPAVASASEGVSEPLRNILADRALSKTPTAELQKQFAAMAFQPPTQKNPRDSFSGRARIFSEIASRGLSGNGEQFLRRALEDRDPLVRREALIGLSDLTRDQLRPLLLAKLADQDRNVMFRAVVMAADFPGDREIAASVTKAAKAAPREDGVLARELWKRLQQPTFCVRPPRAQASK